MADGGFVVVLLVVGEEPLGAVGAFIVLEEDADATVGVFVGGDEVDGFSGDDDFLGGDVAAGVAALKLLPGDDVEDGVWFLGLEGVNVEELVGFEEESAIHDDDELLGDLHLVGAHIELDLFAGVVDEGPFLKLTLSVPAHDVGECFGDEVDAEDADGLVAVVAEEEFSSAVIVAGVGGGEDHGEDFAEDHAAEEAGEVEGGGPFGLGADGGFDVEGDGVDFEGTSAVVAGQESVGAHGHEGGVGLIANAEGAGHANGAFIGVIEGFVTV